MEFDTTIHINACMYFHTHIYMCTPFKNTQTHIYTSSNKNMYFIICSVLEMSYIRCYILYIIYRIIYKIIATLYRTHYIICISSFPSYLLIKVHYFYNVSLNASNPISRKDYYFFLRIPIASLIRAFHTHIHIHSYTDTHIHTHIYTHIYTYTPTHIQTYTHTHTLTHRYLHTLTNIHT